KLLSVPISRVQRKAQEQRGNNMAIGVALVLTISDSAAAGRREDLSGPEGAKILKELGFDILGIDVLPDEQSAIEFRLRQAADSPVDVVVTTGGTGLSPRDVTPEATRAVIDREIPGFGELMRREGAKNTPRAALSRAIAGIRGSTLIINLPGSVKGVRECLGALAPILPHAVETLRQSSLGCGE
ncbi:MAG TPA: MogA/MoaB family molybdenum cofactor biosynthesis protein, partial [Terriglobia bacterium]|nr:MogA/MoaB family molybdenum cofactor biosynthesis protein [Terriglobia bacterium]